MPVAGHDLGRGRLGPQAQLAEHREAVRGVAHAIAAGRGLVEDEGELLFETIDCGERRFERAQIGRGRAARNHAQIGGADGRQRAGAEVFATAGTPVSGDE